MADTETSKVTVPALSAPADDESIPKKTDEQSQATKPMDIPPSKDNEAEFEFEKPKQVNPADPEAASAGTKVKESPPDKNVPTEANSNGVETPVTEPEASAVQETNVEPQGTSAEEKAAEKPLGTEAFETKPKDESKHEVVEKVPDEKPTVEEVKDVEVEGKLTVEQVQSEKEDKEADETIGSVTLAKENPAVELDKSSHEEKTLLEAIGPSAEKSTCEEVDKSIVEEHANNDLKDKSIYDVKSVQDETSLKKESESVAQEVEVSNHEPEEKAAAETLADEKTGNEANVAEAIETVETKQEEAKLEDQSQVPEEKAAVETLTDEKTGNEANVGEAIERVETKQETKLEDQSQVVEKVVATVEQNSVDAGNVQLKNEEKIFEAKLNSTSPPAPVDEAQADNKAARDPSVSEAEKVASGIHNEDSLKEDNKLIEEVGEKKAKDDIIEEDNEKKSFKLGELMQEEAKETDDAKDARNANHAEVAEKTIEKEQASKDIKVTEEKDENMKEDAPTSVETNEEKDSSNSEAIMNEPTEVESKNGQLNVKAEDELESNVMEVAKESDQPKTDENNNNSPQESSKDVENGKESQNLATQEKVAPKQSSNIISKVKQSIVKVKKAIVKKSPSSKTHSPEAKSDGKAK